MANGIYAVIGLLIGLVVLGMFWFYMRTPSMIAIEPTYTTPAVTVPVVPAEPVNPLSMFTIHKNIGCKGRNELGSAENMSVEDCAQRCLNNKLCTVFEMNPQKTQCLFSTTCNPSIATSYPGWILHARN